MLNNIRYLALQGLSKAAQAATPAPTTPAPAAPIDPVANANKAIDMAIPFIAKHEGYSEKAYYDKIGKKWTVGHGHTRIPDPVTKKMRAVTEGDSMSSDASLKLIGTRVRENAAILDKMKWPRKLNPSSLAGMYDVAYNAGPYTLYPAGSPGLNKKVKAKGANPDAIVRQEIPTYRMSNGVPVQGLINRRRNAIRTFYGN